MNTTAGIPLESFNLDEREFERCKHWSSVFKRYETVEDDDDLDYDALQNLYLDEKEEDEEEEKDVDHSIIELEDEENECSPFNQSVIQLRELSSTLLHCQPRNKYSKINDFEMVPLAEDDDEDENFDMQDMLDQTIPIIAERKRKWQESGMLNILNTFDEEKIERKVGRWLRINNSIIPRHVPGQQKQVSDDEEDSLHSIDTARYVLSNRKPRTSGSCCNSTTIKTFRLLQSKRDALRVKYAFPEEELERALLRRVSSSRSAMYRPRKTDNFYHSNHKLDRVCESALVTAKKRRKIFSKHRGRTCTSRCCCSFSSSSSDEKSAGDELYLTPVRQRHSSNLLKTVSATHCKPSAVKPFESFTGHSFTSTDQRSFKINRDQMPQIKPRKRESECCCHNEEKLCKRIEHLADISTEDWVVENCETPKKTKAKTTNVLKSETKISNKKTRSKKMTNQKKKTSIATKTNKATNNNSFLESSFERELKQAMEISKQTYEMENKSKANTNITNDAEPRENKIMTPKSSSKAERTKFHAEVAKTENNHIETTSNNERMVKSCKTEVLEKSRKSLKQKHSQGEEHNDKDRINKHPHLLNASSHSDPDLVTTPKQVLPDQRRKSLKKSQNSLVKEHQNNEDTSMQLLNSLCKKSLKQKHSQDEEQCVKERINKHQHFLNKSSHADPALVTTPKQVLTDQPRKSLKKSEDFLGKEQQNDEKPNTQLLNNLCQTAKRQVSMVVSAEKALEEQAENFVKLPQNSFEKEQLIAEEPPRQSLNKTSKKLKRRDAVDSNVIETVTSMEHISPASLGIKPQPKSAKLKKINRLLTQSQTSTSLQNEETFFSMAHKICNSTAVNDAAVTLTKQISTYEPCTSQAVATSTATDDHECSIVSSTTAEPQSQNRSISCSTNNVNRNDILLYSPHNLTLVPAHSCSEGVFQVTEEHLTSIIGEKAARKFMKYYIGRRRFDANLTVYYRPPRHNYAINDDDDDTDSDVDELEKMYHYGDLYVLFDK